MKIKLSFQSMIIVFLSFFCFNSAEAATNYAYRKLITLTNTGLSTLTNYEVPISVVTSDISSHIQSDGRDIRFTAGTNTSFDGDSWTGGSYNYWINGSVNLSGSTTIWVRVASIAANTTTQIYMYYGNSSVSAVSSVSSAFSFYDDFSTSTKWTSAVSGTGTGSGSVSNGQGLSVAASSDTNYGGIINRTVTYTTNSNGPINSGVDSTYKADYKITYNQSAAGGGGTGAYRKDSASTAAFKGGPSGSLTNLSANTIATAVGTTPVSASISQTQVTAAGPFSGANSTLQLYTYADAYGNPGSADATLYIDDVYVYQSVTGAPTGATSTGSEQMRTQSFGITPTSGSSPITLSITAKDGAGSAVNDYSTYGATVTLTKDKATAKLNNADSVTLLKSDFDATGIATVTLTDTVVESVTITATVGSPYNITSTQAVSVTSTAATKIVFTSSTPSYLTAGTAYATAYTVQVQDAAGNQRSSDSLTLTLASSSSGGKFDTSSGGAFNGSVTSITTSSGNGTFYYKDTTAGTPTITVSYTGLTSATQQQTVRHAAADHMAFTTDITTPKTAGTQFNLPAINVYDVYNNICDNSNGATAYSGAKTIAYDLSGTDNGLDGTLDSYTTTVDFSNGSSTTPLATTLFRSQSTTVTPSCSADSLTGTASNSVTVNAASKVKLAFTTEPPSSSLVNVALQAPNIPVVAIRDSFNNQTTDTDNITISAVTASGGSTAASGTLTSSAANNTVAGPSATFNGVKYDTIETVYLYATSGSLQPDWSSAITFGKSSTSTVEAPASQVADFNLEPTSYDSLAEKVAVLKFKINDDGSDRLPTLIDRMQITVGGTGGAASTDIAWAGLYIGDTQVATATGANIENNRITFGSAPNSNNSAGLYSVTDDGNAHAVEFTVYVYLKNTKLTAIETNTYTFYVDENGIGTDTGVSSQMNTGHAAQITAVTTTIAVTVSKLEVVTSDGSATVSPSPTAGQTTELLVRATDANKNIDRGFTGSHVLKFSGLNAIGSYNPKIETVNFGYNMSVSFSSGVSATNAVTLTAYKAESGDVSVQDMDTSPVNHTGYTAFTLAATVQAGSPNTISSTSGNNQSGKTTEALANSFVVTVTDLYGNPVSGTSVAFAVSSQPSGAGAAVSITTATTNSSGQASTVLTLGSLGGTYQVTATSSGLSGSPITFSATALAPANITITAGNNQTGTVTSPLGTALTVKLTDSNNTPIPNTTVTFSITSTPSGAAGQTLSAASATTDANGLASVNFTLGDKTGDYVVRAANSGISVDFTETATAGAVNKVVLSGPGSATAGSVSTAFTITLKDVSDNVKAASSDTVFSLTSDSATGAFYSDSAGTISISSKTVSSGYSSSTFYYKDTATGNAAITVSRTSGDSLTVSSSSYSTNIVAADLSYFKVTGTGSTLTAGGSLTITIKGYDTHNNLKTNLNGDYTITFSGANTSPSPKSQAPTCSDKNSSDVNFGTGTVLTFSSGQVTSTLKLYKAEAASIKATAGAVTTSGANDLDITVKHASADHLKFTADIPVPGGGFTVGSSFPLGTLNALDFYDNLCDGGNGATAYSGTKTVNYTLSGSANAPDGSQTDSWITSVGFTAGASTSTLTTTLYRAQSTTITPVTSGLSGTNIVSNSITVAAGAVAKLYFSQQPSTDTPIYTNVALPRQPKVAVADQYGNATSSSDQITLAAYTLSGGIYTAVTNGTLSGDALSVNTSNGTATFSGIKYSYPETIYLRAHSSGGLASDIYSNAVELSLGQDTTFTAGSLSEPSTISSLVYTNATKVQVFDFKVTDVGSDGYATKIKKIVINKGASDTTGGWLTYIAGATISDGTTTVLGAITNSTLTFGDGNSVIYTVSDNTNKTYTLSIYLAQTLPSGADQKVIQFSIDPNDDITLDTLTSTFSAASAMTTSLTVSVVATKFIVTGSVSTVNAGTSSTVTVKLTDVNGNIDTNGYEGSQAVIFSGASTAVSGTHPTCTNYVGTAVNFGNDTLVSFSSGQGTATMKLYKAETISIKAKLSADTTITTADGDDLDIKVNGGTASKLSWDTQPYTTIVANSPWRPFKVAVSDAYDNVASSSTTVTLTASGGTITSGATSSVTAVSGIATFNNFAVYCSSYPGSVTVNATATGVTESGASNAVTVVEKYAVTLKVLDSVNGSALSNLTLTILDAATGLAIGTVSPNPTTGNSPLKFMIPYGKYNFDFTKSAYVELTEEKTTDVNADAADTLYDNDITWTFFMISVSESLADYRVLSNFVYDEGADKLTANMRLEKRGKQIVDDAINTLKTCTLKIYASTDAGTAIYTSSLATPDANGNYWFNISNAVATYGFASGKGYFAKMTIVYGGSNLSTNVTYSAVNTFDIGVALALKTATAEIKTEVTGVKSTVSTEAAATRTKVDSESTEVQEKVASESTTVQTKVAAVKTETASILTAAETTIPGKITTAQENIMSNIDTDIEPYIKAGILNRENLIKLGSTINVQYRTVTGKSPTLTVYAPNNTIKINSVVMTEVGTTGIYEYSVTFASGWGVGEYTVVCSESTRGTVDALVITVVRHDIEEIAGQTASILGATSGLSSLKNVSDTISAQFKLLDQALGTLSEKIVSKVEGTKSIVSDLESVYNQLGSLSKQIKGIGGTVGISLDKLYEVSKDKKEDINYLKNKAEELKAVMDLNKKMMENVAKKPVVQTWFEYR